MKRKALQQLSRSRAVKAIKDGRYGSERNKSSFSNVALRRPGGHGGVAAPVPIPNTAVKHPSADGTSSQDAGE